MKTEPELTSTSAAQVQEFFSTLRVQKMRCCCWTMTARWRRSGLIALKRDPGQVFANCSAEFRADGSSLTTRIVFISGRPAAEIGPLLGLN